MRRLRLDEAHRALGHYVFAFSSLVSQMREAVEYAVAGDSDDRRKNASLAMGAAFAEPITISFFAICERQADPDDEEQGVMRRLRSEVTKAIADRNDFAHGDWGLRWPDQGPNLQRIKPGRRDGAWIDRIRPVEEIDAMADALEELTDMIYEIALLCLGIHPLQERGGRAVRIRDIYRFRKHKVLRIGRYADLPWFEEEDVDEQQNWTRS